MTPIPGPIILLALPLLAAGITYLVRRLTIVAAFLSAATTAALALLCLRLPLDRSAFVLGQEVAFGRPVVVLGRTLVLDQTGQLWLAFIFAVAAVFYLFAWRMSQGRSFFPFSLTILSSFALIALVQTFSLAVIVFAISTTLAVFVIQGGLRSVRGAQRYLVVTLLAVPVLLAAAWFVDQSVLNPENSDMARQALLPAAIGFGLLLGAFPFGTWMPAMASDAPPIAVAFVFSTGQAMALFLALGFMQNTPVSLNDPAVSDAILLIGLMMAASGGVMAAVQRDFGRLYGYAALSDLGILLLAFPAGGSQGLTLALLHLVNRSAAMTLLAAALSILRHRATTDHFDKLGGVAQRVPIATLGLMLGGLALAGFPFTAGFPTHWAVSRAVWNLTQPLSAMAREMTPIGNTIAIRDWTWVLAIVALLASSAGVVIGLLRGLGVMLRSDPRQDVAGQPAVASLMVLALMALVVILGLYPHIFLAPIQRAVQGFSLF